jgi:hypothetical protein
MQYSSFLSGLWLTVVLGFVPAAQGDVWVVDDTAGPGVDFATIQHAIDSASVDDGDVLLVRPGSYGQFRAWNGKALTIQADGSGVQVSALPSVRNLPAGESFLIHGLALRGLELSGCAGTLWVEECAITGVDGVDAVAVDRCSDVILIRVVATGGDGTNCAFDYAVGRGLVVWDRSSVQAYGCRFEGGPAGTRRLVAPGFPCGAEDGGAGVDYSDGTDQLFLSDCEVLGGPSTSCQLSGLGDCFCGSGGVGLVSDGRSILLECTVTGGPALFHPSDCGVPTPGADYTGQLEFLPGRALRATVGSPVRENGTVAIHLEGPPNVPVWMLYAGFPRASVFRPDVRGVRLLPSGHLSGTELL